MTLLFEGEALSVRVEGRVFYVERSDTKAIVLSYMRGQRPKTAKTRQALIEALKRFRALGLHRTAPRFAYVVVASAANVPGKFGGSYRRIGLLRIAAGLRAPERIANGPGVKVVQTWERLNVGKTEKSAFATAMREATALAEKMNRNGSHTK